ncbi:hypothetical protein VTO73DRAFT_10735 [Trametes versicolor]
MAIFSAFGRLKKWFHSRRSMPKRSRSNWQTTRYAFDDDDDGASTVGDKGAQSSSTMERHRHVDWCHDTARPSAKTSYVDVPSLPTKRPRSSSLPSLNTIPASCGDDDDDDASFRSFHSSGSDLSYFLERDASLDDEAGPRRRTAGDRPLLQWIPEVPRYLDELLWLEGRGHFANLPCPTCGLTDTELYRCVDCDDPRLFCQRCTVEYHSRHPYHRIQLWQATHFVRVSLKSLGLRVQLGHVPGDKCVHPIPCHGDDFVLLDLSGVHELSLNFCGCKHALPHYIQLLRARWFPATSSDPKTAATFRVLETFQILSVQSKISGWEFYQTLARRTDNTGTDVPKDRYMAFMLMSRQWRHLKMLKRSGRGHSPFGLADQHEGSCAVECPACPLPGKNMPTDWKTAPLGTRWIYRIFLAIDANFRLKRRMVSSDAVDPSLNQGSAYIVEDNAYKAHLKAFDTRATESTSHCNNHDAVKLAQLKGSASLAATGVASVICSRHEMKRPCSTGDLQKGERFVNIDYLFHSSLQQNTPTEVAASYDIACTYDVNLDKRFMSYGYDISSHNITWAIPKFHINAHREQCRADYNLLYLPASARNDGEAIERIWSQTNAAASSTKEMGPGSRRDALDDIFGDHNWQKVCRMARSLLDKVKKAVPEANLQVAAFEDFNAALPQETTHNWQTAVERWEADRAQPNPFLMKRPSITQASIRRQLAEEDQQSLQQAPLHTEATSQACSASGMIVAGLDLEDLQLRIKNEVLALPAHATDLQRARALERENALKRRIDAWCQLQQLYMPDAATERARRSSDKSLHLAYNIPLLLPSSALPLISVSLTLIGHEWRLRLGQAFDALSDLRGHLELRTHLYKFKDRFVRGQRANTRAQSVVKAIDAKINHDAERYRLAYSALLVLEPYIPQKELLLQLRPLQQSDIRHVTEGDDGQSEGRRAVSWIWQSTPTPGSLNGEAGTLGDSLQESLRVEWCKARARARRWTEEVVLLQEEMRRVVAYHKWVEDKWSDFVDGRFPNHLDYREGTNAYAHRQAATRASMRMFCEKAWKDVSLWVSLGDDADSVPAVENAS